MKSVIVLGIAALAAFAQSAAPEFEVASLKPSPPFASAYDEGFRLARASRDLVVQGERVTMTDQSLKDLVRIAYQVKPYQVTGAKWMETERYDIAAKLRAGASAAEAPAMLRSLLAARFHLAVRRESKELPVYALAAGKGGLKMKASTGPATDPAAERAATLKQMVRSEQNVQTGMPAAPGAPVVHIRGKELTIASLVDRLSFYVDRPVVDLTGIEGKYELDLTFARGEASELAPSLATALQEQLGLKLDPRKMPVESIVIERADKVPAEN
jgi:uncharacterized protein (TIGR03435 family)